MLHFHTHNFEDVHDYFGMPFQQEGSIQDEMQIERFCIVSDRHYLLNPGSRLAQIR
jgi:hypothetical protein